MASTIIQNCQRGTVFICFLAALFFFIMNTISLIKKRLDPINEEGDAGKYKPEADVAEGKNKPRPSSESINNLDMVVTRNTEVEDSDEGIIKVIKRFHDLELNYFSILIVFPLNIVTGTSKVFQMVDFFIIIICIVLFNIAKIHQSITQHKCIRLVLDNIWLLLCFFLLLNVWTTTSTLQPYIVI